MNRRKQVIHELAQKVGRSESAQRQVGIRHSTPTYYAATPESINHLLMAGDICMLFSFKPPPILHRYCNRYWILPVLLHNNKNLNSQYAASRLRRFYFGCRSTGKRCSGADRFFLSFLDTGAHSGADHCLLFYDGTQHTPHTENLPLFGMACTCI